MSNIYRSSPPEVLLGTGVLKICSKFTGEHLCQSVISIKLLSNFIEIALRHGCSPVNLPHIFRASFPKNISGGQSKMFSWDLLKFRKRILSRGIIVWVSDLFQL